MLPSSEEKGVSVPVDIFSLERLASLTLCSFSLHHQKLIYQIGKYQFKIYRNLILQCNETTNGCSEIIGRLLQYERRLMTLAETRAVSAANGNRRVNSESFALSLAAQNEALNAGGGNFFLLISEIVFKFEKQKEVMLSMIPP